MNIERVERLVPRVERWLDRFGAWVAAAIAVAFIWSVWGGGGHPAPIFHDEDAYALQARIFARGTWTVPSPPLAEFFEQPHVFSWPAVAAKYPPGHPLLLAPGALVGWLPLMPLLLTAASAALLFRLVSRVANPWLALVTWCVWLTMPIVLRYQPSYFSQVTTTALLLTAWWSLLRWRESRHRRWMLVLAFAIAWGGITRPVSMLAFALPIGVVVVRDVIARRTWRDLAAGLMVGLAVLALVPLWNLKTTGSWSETPVGAYRRQYLPFDKLGFAVDTTPPERRSGPVMRELYDEFRSHRERQSRIGPHRLAATRLRILSRAFFGRWETALVPLAALGLFLSPAAVQVAAAGVLLLFLGHLPYAHDASWTLYYLEAAPVLAVLAACGMLSPFAWLAGRRGRQPAFGTALPPLAALSAMVAALVILSRAPIELRTWRKRHAETGAFAREFTGAMRTLPVQPAIVFVRYSPSRQHFVNLVKHHADPASAAVWVVHDLGPRNAELRRIAPDRATYLFDENEMVLRRQP